MLAITPLDFIVLRFLFKMQADVLIKALSAVFI